jgi:integrase
MRLYTAVNQYISYRKALGEHFRTDSETLNTFVRAMGKDANLTDVKPESVTKYLAGKAPVITANWHRKYYALHGFYKYALSRGYAQASPIPLTIPKPPPPFVPYIYNTEELRALFNTCLSYQKNRGVLDPYMVRTFILLLYGTGLRLSEAISLTLDDVDLNQAILIIRNTKFHKTRLVPMGKQLTQILLDYATWRKQKKYAVNPEAPFFVGRNGKAINGYNVQDAFELIRKKAGILRTDTSQQPRLHDLRHTFAVHRLTAWYKQGADVQSLLPVLSVYMGHVCISSTSTYLTMTPTLLEEAGRRFEQYAFNKEESHD